MEKRLVLPAVLLSCASVSCLEETCGSVRSMFGMVEFDRPKPIKHIFYLHGLGSHGMDAWGRLLEQQAEDSGLTFTGSDFHGTVSIEGLAHVKWLLAGASSTHINSTRKSHAARPLFNALEYTCNCVLDELAALAEGETREERYKSAAEHTLLIGQSFGGAIATKLMRDYRIRPSGVILGCPALVPSNFISSLLWPTFRLDAKAFGEDMDPKRITLIHGENDSIVRVTGSRQVKQALPQITYHEVAHTRHGLELALQIRLEEEELEGGVRRGDIQRRHPEEGQILDVNTGAPIPSLKELVREKLEASRTGDLLETRSQKCRNVIQIGRL